MSALIPPAELAALRILSARIGADPTLIQAAGGNTSVKDGDVMWIKASGTLLAEALTRDLFVPVDLPRMRAVVLAGLPDADQPQKFALQGTLRPSIETCLHAVFSQRVVVHVHSVNAIALAIRADAREVLGQRLASFNWAFVPYVKPGAHLAAGVVAVLGPDTDVIVLANHGLIVSAASVAEAEALLALVVDALAPDRILPPSPPDMAALTARAAGHGFAPVPADHCAHQVALNPHMLAAATKGSLYPDHVIFLGIGTTVLAQGETPSEAVAARGAQGMPPPVFLVVAGQGVLMATGASSGAWAMLRCLGDVLTRLPEGIPTQALSVAEDGDLLNWDAEKYRQALNTV
jgi:rhamnose utilization protein RhaD (predicted bifunctional aldolase and dehydrogenase)